MAVRLLCRPSLGASARSALSPARLFSASIVPKQAPSASFTSISGVLSLAVQRARFLPLDPALIRVAHAEEAARRSGALGPRLAVNAHGLQPRGPVRDLTFWELCRELVALLDWFWLGATVAAAVATAAVGVALPRATGQLVNALTRLVKGESAELTSAALRMAFLSLSNAVLTFAYISSVSIVGERLAERLRTRLFSSLLSQDIYFFDSHKTGDLLSRLTSDVQEFKHSVKGLIGQGVKAVTQTAGGLASMMSLSPLMTGALVVSLPLIYAVGSLYGSFLRRVSARARSADAEAAGHATECLHHVRTVRAFATEPRESERFAELTGVAARLHEAQGLHIGAFQGLTNLSFSGLFLGILWLGGSQVGDGRLAAGDLMNFLMTTQSTQKSLGALVALLGTAGKAMGAGARALEYAAMSPLVALTGGATIPSAQLRGDIVFDSVDFAYPSRPEQRVLNGLQLRLAPGKVTALCGPSGGGKSTVAALIERFYEPINGEISLDGRDISRLDPSWLRSQIGYISQEPALFGTSVLENIRYGRPDATDEQVIAAARQANAHDFISAFPDGYATRVGERGVALSGGQRQRIAIARALLKDPKILILDEATSALDAESERLVQAALDKLMRGRTVLVIAHRLSTLHNADCIAVMHPRAKRIIETGTHAQLMGSESFYRNLYQQWKSEDFVE